MHKRPLRLITSVNTRSTPDVASWGGSGVNVPIKLTKRFCSFRNCYGARSHVTQRARNCTTHAHFTHTPIAGSCTWKKRERATEEVQSATSKFVHVRALETDACCHCTTLGDAVTLGQRFVLQSQFTNIPEVSIVLPTSFAKYSCQFTM